MDNLNEETFACLVNKIFLKKYHMRNIRELIFSIHAVTEITMKYNYIVTRFISSRVSKRLYDEIKNITNLGEILIKLIEIDVKRNSTNKYYVDNFDYFLNEKNN